MSEPRVKSRIPEFASIEEEAEFWDTHDTTDFEDEFRPVKFRLVDRLSEAMTVRLDRRTLNDLRELAGEKGVGPSTLARMWLLERVRAERAAQAKPRK